MDGSIQPDGCIAPKRFSKLRNRLWDYDHCIELEDLSDPVGDNLVVNLAMSDSIGDGL